ncbi:13E12 repeat family protein, partial [Mycobacterium sp. Y57]|uniref:DUF222 domain-containing protein n=1 Tax=Mycolicibacterium xanthum TaxID=2796469 RepID=UPI001C846C9C
MFDTLADVDLLAVVDDSHRQESMVMARKLAAIAQLLARRVEAGLAVDEDMASVISGFNRTAAEVAAVMNMTPGAARTLVAAAEALDVRLPAVGALLATGGIDWRTT